MYQELDHTADCAIRVWGADRAELFADAAKGMYWLAGATTGEAGEEIRHLTLTASDQESLLVRWLQELAYWLESESRVVSGISFQELTMTHLDAEMTCGTATSIARFIKAVTYHDLAIVPVGGGLQTAIVFDV